MGTQGSVGPTGPAGPAGPQGFPGPQGPAGPAGSGAYAEDEPGFAGFTPATYTGNLGGRPAAHGICAAAFPGGHLCHASEYLLSTPTGIVPATGAWLDASATWDGNVTAQGATPFGRYTSYSCANFTNDQTNVTGSFVNTSGSITFSSVNACNTLRPLACCNGAPKHVLAGFSASAYTGNIGSREAVHAICHAEFPGAHLCHAAEYLRTVSATPVPAPGAWIDASADLGGDVTAQGAPIFGRYTSYSCASFTNDQTNVTGSFVNTNGSITFSSVNNCNTPKRIACCM